MKIFDLVIEPGQEEHLARHSVAAAEVEEVVDRWLAGAGVHRERVAIGNVIQCQLPGNRKPKRAEVRHCWIAHIRPWLNSLSRVRVVVPVGIPAMEALIGGKAKAGLAGTLHVRHLPWPEEPYAAPERTSDILHRMPQDNAESSGDLFDLFGEAETGKPEATEDALDASDSSAPNINLAGWNSALPDRPVILAPLLHPAFILRGMFSQEPMQVRYLRHAGAIAASDEAPWIPDVREPPPGHNPTPSLSEIEHFVNTTAVDDMLACDAEYFEGHRGVGFCRLRDLTGIYIALEHDHELVWPSEGEQLRVDTALRTLTRCPLVCHNGQGAEIGFFDQLDIEINYADDTMIRHHILYAEQRKRLEELAVLYLSLPSWKWLSRAGDDEKEDK